MNSYIIAPDDTSYQDLIKAYACIKRTAGRGRKASREASPVVISSRDAFDAESFKDQFKSPADTDTIFIVPELNWGNDHTFLAGYKVAEELLTEKLAGDFFVNIIFVSGLSRNLLSRMFAKTEYAGLIQSFPHMTLDDLQKTMRMEEKDREPAPVPLYSPVQFELLKRVVISRFGKLDFVRHKLSHLEDIDTSDPEQKQTDILAAKSSIQNVLDLLALPSYGGESPLYPEIRRCRSALREVKSEEDIHQQVLKVKQLIDDILNQLRKDSVASTNKSSNGYKVLIVEDDAFYRKQMTSFFKKYLGPETEVVAYDNAMITGEIFPDKPGDVVRDARSRIVEEVGKYNIVILDMMYTIDGKEDSPMALFNGFDLYNALRDAEVKSQKRRAVVRVITALPRNDVSRLFKKHVTAEPPAVFTKGNRWEQLEGCLRDRMDEILKDCGKNEESYLEGIPFPKRGVFRHPGMYEAVAANREKLKIAMDFARDVAEGKKKLTPADCELISKKDPKALVDHLKAIMANRRLVIKFLSSETAPVYFDNENVGGTSYFDEEKYGEFIKDYLNEEAQKTKAARDFNKGYLCTKLGFKVSQLPDENRGNRDGFLTKKDIEPAFKGRIDLEDDLQFFPGELDSPQKEKTSEALLRLMEQVCQVMERELEHEQAKAPKKSFAKAFSDSGISDFLQKKKKTVASFKKMLEGVRRYLDSNNGQDLRMYLQKIFNDHFNLEFDNVKMYNEVLSESKKIAQLLKTIVEIEI